jgi:hypothetical protein
MGAHDEEDKSGKAMATGMRVAGDNEGKGKEEGNGVGHKGGVQQIEQLLWQQEQWQ